MSRTEIQAIQQNVVSRLLAPLVVATLVVSCGGGGGGGNGSTSIPPPQLSIDASNALLVGTLAISSGETILMLADEAAVVLQKADGTSPFGSVANCLHGTASYEFTDNDQDGGLSIGDTAHGSYVQCETAATNGTVSGELIVTLEQMDTARGADDVRYVADVNTSALSILYDSGNTVTALGEMRLDFERGIYEARLRATGRLNLTASGLSILTADWSAIDVSKRESYETAQYTVSMSGLVKSNAYDGTAQVSTNNPLSAPFNTYPMAGEFELAGDNGSHIRVRSDGGSGSDLAIFSLDEAGDGSYVDLPDMLTWEEFTWGYLWWYELSSPFSYVNSSFDINDFRILNFRPNIRSLVGAELIGPNPTVRVQTSREVDPLSLPNDIQMDLISRQWPFHDLVVDLDVEVRGALMLFRPMQQLAHGSSYSFPSQFFWFSDINGNLESLSSFDTNISVADSLVSAVSPQETYGFPGDQIVIDASGSFSDDGSMITSEWSQVLGPTMQFAGVNQAVATLTLPDAPATTLLRMHHKATNSFGEFDFAKSDITLFPTDTDINLIVVRTLTIESDILESILTSANGTQLLSNNISNSIYITHDTDYVIPELSAQLRSDWRLTFASPLNTIITTGVYDNITSVVATDDEPGLWVAGEGQCQGLAGFDILEFTSDLNGDPDKLAINFYQECDGAYGYDRRAGYVRLRSTIPVPGTSDLLN